jgi:Fe-S-cluster containining protein
LSQSDPHSLLEAFYARVEARTAALSARHAERLKCKQGCSACCLDDITVFTLEAEHIRARHAQLLGTGAPHPRGACAFLDESGACRIYAERPYVCRTHGLPLAWVEERELADGDAEFVELRDICHLNEAGEPLEELAPEDCWRIGSHEGELRALQQAHAGNLHRVSLRSLFARVEVCEGDAERAFARAWRALDAEPAAHTSLHEALQKAEVPPQHRSLVRESLRLALHHEGRVRALIPRLLPAHWPRALHIASLVFAGALDRARAAQFCPAVAWDEFLARDAARRADPDPVRALAQSVGVAPFLAERLLAEYADDAATLVRGWQQRPVRALRANTLIQDRDALLAALRERGVRAVPGAFAKASIVLDAEHEFQRARS